MIKEIPLTPVKTFIKTINWAGVKEDIFKKVDINVLLERTKNRLKNTNNESLEKIQILHTSCKDNMLTIYDEWICKKKIIEPRTFGIIIDRFVKLMYQTEQINDITANDVVNIINTSNVLTYEKQMENTQTKEVIDQLIYNVAQSIASYKRANNPYATLTELITESYFLTIMDLQYKQNKFSDSEYLEKLKSSKSELKQIFIKHPDIAWLINILSFISYLHLTSTSEKFTCDDIISCDYSLTYDTQEKKDCHISSHISGEIDFQSQNEILDLKISKSSFTIDHIMQVALYYMLSSNKESIKTLKLYNPLLNQSLIISPNDVLKVNDIGEIINITAAKYLEKHYEWKKKAMAKNNTIWRYTNYWYNLHISITKKQKNKHNGKRIFKIKVTNKNNKINLKYNCTNSIIHSNNKQTW